MKEKEQYAPPVVPGVEDRFYYVISGECVMCGICAQACPTKAIAPGEGRYEIDPAKCIDCGTCAYVCPTGVPLPV